MEHNKCVKFSKLRRQFAKKVLKKRVNGMRIFTGTCQTEGERRISKNGRLT